MAWHGVERGSDGEEHLHNVHGLLDIHGRRPGYTGDQWKPLTYSFKKKPTLSLKNTQLTKI